MPRHLHLALEIIEAWPRLEGLTYSSWINHEGHIGYPKGGDAVAEYLHSVSVWRRFGFMLELEDRERIRELWKHRPELRYVLGEAIGFHVCEEFARPFLRSVLRGGHGDVAAWVAEFPELRAPLVEYFRERIRRFNHPFEVVGACITLTRDLGEPPEAWRAAALAIHRDDRRQARLPPRRRSDFLRHDLETHGTIVPAEGERINEFLAELGGERLDVMQFGYWWHPVPLARGEVLARVAGASWALARERWGEEDVRVYARALAGLSGEQAESFVADRPWLQRIAEAARGLMGP